jgi:hypothetical protein
MSAVTDVCVLLDPIYQNASFSPERVYRYTLTRIWRQPREQGEAFAGARYVAFIGLNPSTADETTDDPTVRRCIRFAQRWGLDAMVMLNLFAFRSVSPGVLKAHGAPVGLQNDAHIVNWCRGVELIVPCWGVHGVYLDRDREVQVLLEPFMDKVRVLGQTKAGFPRHPLYLAGETELQTIGWKVAA